MTEKTIREIRSEKGGQFTAEFIRDFDRDWRNATQRLRESGTELDFPTARGK